MSFIDTWKKYGGLFGGLIDVTGFNPFAPDNSIASRKIQPIKTIINNQLPSTSTSVKNFDDSFSKAIDNALSAFSSSALDYQKQALAEQQNFNAEQAKLAFERSQSSAREQMQFQKEMQKDAQAYNTLMSNTQYQRAVADLKKAGINPIMAIKGLDGSSPTVSAVSGASASSPSASSSQTDYTKGLSEDKRVIEAILGMLSSSASILKLLK